MQNLTDYYLQAQSFQKFNSLHSGVLWIYHRVLRQHQEYHQVLCWRGRTIAKCLPIKRTN